MHSTILFIYLCIGYLLVMNSIFKIVLALKLKFLLIILGIGSSYFLEYHIKKQEDAFSNTGIIRPENNLRGTGNINARSLFNTADDSDDSDLKASDYFRVHPINYVSNRPFNYQGLEIYIVL